MASLKGVSAETTLRQFASSNGSEFSPTINEIRIPVSGANGFLDVAKSYLYFVIKNKNADAGEKLTLDSDGLCWLDSIRIESQGVLLERLDRAALYQNLKARWQKDITHVHSHESKAGGPLSFDGANAGESIDEAKERGICCQLPLGFLHSHHGKALPAGTQFDIVLRVNPTAASCFVWEKADKYAFTITNPRFYCPLYRVENREVMSEYAQVLSTRGISWDGTCVKTYVQPVSGSGPKTLQINDRSRSLKGLISAKRVTADLTDRAKHSQSSTNITGITQVVYNIAGRNMPQDPMQVTTTDYCRLYDECAKAFAPHGETHAKPHVKASAFVGDRGMMAVDLRRFSDERLTDVGIDTTGGSPNVLELVCTGDNVASDVTTYALCDCTWTIQPNGVLSASM